MNVIIDTSVWIDYFKQGEQTSIVDVLIDENLITTNDIILAELVPFLRVKKQKKLIRLLYKIRKLPLKTDWDEIIEFQVKCIRKGINGVGIPDLIIAQNSKHHQCKLYSLDKHFRLLNEVVDVDLFD
ncbi:MAG: PIN domain-containing protein [Balneolaceae bacterium]|nr:PIN domain-containing protein [Balneolaceae bacterium]